MRFFFVALATLPPSLAATAYTAPPILLSKAKADDGCVLPEKYHVKNFSSRSNGTGDALECLRFTFSDPTTSVTTLCQWNESSVTTTPSGLTPRYACDDAATKFIWEADEKRMTMVERVCPGSDGIPDYEASGSVFVPVSCAAATQICTVNSTDYTGVFTSLQPVRDPTLV